MLQGYTLTGRTALFPTYEAFLGIVHTMMVQYSKFTKLVRILNLSSAMRFRFPSSRLLRLIGVMTSALSIIWRLPLGLGKSTTVSRTKTLHLLVRYSI